MKSHETKPQHHRIWCTAFGRPDLVDSQRYRCNRWGIWDGSTLVWESPAKGGASPRLRKTYNESLAVVKNQKEADNGMGQ
jgi:hypothetical protein